MSRRSITSQYCTVQYSFWVLLYYVMTGYDCTVLWFQNLGWAAPCTSVLYVGWDMPASLLTMRRPLCAHLSVIKCVIISLGFLHTSSLPRYDVAEMPASIESWDNLVHPDDKEGAYAALKDHLDGVTEAYSHEHRMRCKDGTYRCEPPIPTATLPCASILVQPLSPSLASPPLSLFLSLSPSLSLSFSLSLSLSLCSGAPVLPPLALSLSCCALSC